MSLVTIGNRYVKNMRFAPRFDKSQRVQAVAYAGQANTRAPFKTKIETKQTVKEHLIYLITGMLYYFVFTRHYGYLN